MNKGFSLDNLWGIFGNILEEEYTLRDHSSPKLSEKQVVDNCLESFEDVVDLIRSQSEQIASLKEDAVTSYKEGISEGVGIGRLRASRELGYAMTPTAKFRQGDRTVVRWSDDTVTYVDKTAGEEENEELAVALCALKRLFGLMKIELGNSEDMSEADYRGYYNFFMGL